MIVTGPGPWPGGPAADPLEAQRAVFDELTGGSLPGAPFAVQLSGRGPEGGPVARAAALLVEMPLELGPHGWRLADRPGGDLRRARALWRDDLEALAIAGSGYSGPLTLTVVGPWTLAATLYLARGDRVLCDRGAVRELVQSFAAGVAQCLAQVRRGIPAGEVTLVLDEPLLADVLGARVPTFSGRGQLRAVSGPDVVDGLAVSVAAVRAAGVRVVVADGVSTTAGRRSARYRGSAIAPAIAAGADAVAVELGPWHEALWQEVGRAHERGLGLWAVVPGTGYGASNGSRSARPDTMADALTVPWLRTGLSAAALLDVTLLPGIGEWAGNGPVPGDSAGSRRALALVRQAAEIATERALT